MGEVLAYCSTFDGRIVEGESGAMIITSWHGLLGHFTVKEAREAVDAYYKHNDRRLMPSDIFVYCDERRDQWLMANPNYSPANPHIIPYWEREDRELEAPRALRDVKSLEAGEGKRR